jgi:hypothetical protein
MPGPPNGEFIRWHAEFSCSVIISDIYYFRLAGLILAARMRDLQANRANPYCTAHAVIVSIPMKRTGRLFSINERKAKREDKNEKTRDALCNAR